MVKLVSNPEISMVTDYGLARVLRHLGPLLLTWFDFNPNMDK